MAIEALSSSVSGMQSPPALNSQTSPGSLNAAASGVGSQDAAASYKADVSSQSDVADVFRETMGKLHDQLAQFNADSGTGPAADPVEVAKADILPSPWKSSPTGASPAAGTGAAGASDVASAPATSAPTPASSPAREGNAVLRKSFDHAIYVTLVSQVVTGLSQTTSTLIRQQ